jgi:hypothetical protein
MGLQKIQLDVDRNIYQSKNASFQFQANAKKLSAYFNRKRLDGTWDLGVWVCSNPDGPYWKDHNPRDNTYMFLDVPEGAKQEIDGNTITYDYGEIAIKFDVLMDIVRRTVIVKSRKGLDVLDQFLKYNATFSKIAPSVVNDKHYELKDNDVVELRVKTNKMTDSNSLTWVEKCKMEKKLCNTGEGYKDAKEHCASCTHECAAFVSESTAEYDKNALDDKALVLLPDTEWLNDVRRVFPIFINDDITPASTSITGYGNYATNTANIFDGNNGTYGGTACSGSVVHDEGDGFQHYLDIDLGDTYVIEGFDWRAYNICGINYGWDTYPNQYWRNILLHDDDEDDTYDEFSPRCLTTNEDDEVSPQNYYEGNTISSNDVSSQNVSARYIRLWTAGTKTGWASSGLYGSRMQVSEITIYGSSGSSNATATPSSQSLSLTLPNHVVDTGIFVDVFNLRNQNYFDQTIEHREYLTQKLKCEDLLKQRVEAVYGN